MQVTHNQYTMNYHKILYPSDKLLMSFSMYPSSVSRDPINCFSLVSQDLGNYPANHTKNSQVLSALRIKTLLHVS